jgi:hypothetical protein
MSSLPCRRRLVQSVARVTVRTVTVRTVVRTLIRVVVVESSSRRVVV